ncbi:Putative mycofactocin radical SAM maturase MftC [Pontiella desulfatans]|uniref:Mycofactocin radical SAM maturase MftC n=1 Tax=Pontiella desulfatans TaxID=2750659 RepID=A0A6C2TXN9_PONDE|nr:radical SAM protein [Pontiella desulfatans]VGO12036.1 Putative mycofactocin radical SAM maturase MftC [Pontiella desulfatans]
MSCHAFCDEAGFSLEEIKAAAADGRLLTMEIECSRVCNFRCPYCYQDAETHNELTLDEIKALVLQARDLGAQGIIILGGEPMIYPHIFEVIEYICESGMKVELFTNGSNITAENAQRLADLDVKVVLKLNSRNPEVQNKLCGIPNAHAIISSAFGNLKSAGYGDGGKPMAASSIISALNYDELEEMWNWLRDQRIDPYFEMITPQGGAVENDWVYEDPKKVEELFEKFAESDRKRFGVDWKPQPPLAGERCMRHQFSCYVDAVGNVMPCVGVDIPVGNIREKPLKQVLAESEVIQDLRNHLQEIKGPCAECPEKEGCYGCRGAAYQMTGDYLASDPLCWKNIDKQHEIDRLPIAAEGLIPQQAPMQMVESLLFLGERRALVQTVVGESNLFLDEDGNLEEVAYIEMVAQAAALFNGFRTRHRDEDPAGFLLGAKGFTFHGNVQAGDRLVVEATKDTGFGAFSIVNGRVLRGEECMAEGQIKIYHEEASA